MTETESLLRIVGQAFDHRSWHGPNLMGTLRGVKAELAGWRPGPKRHNIHEHVVHAAYWKYSVTRRIVGAERGSFGEKGSNWFPRPDRSDAPHWRADLALLHQHHDGLIRAIEGMAVSRWNEIPQGSATTIRDLVIGVAFHDVHHAAQIALIKRLKGEIATSNRSAAQPRRRS